MIVIKNFTLRITKNEKYLGYNMLEKNNDININDTKNDTSNMIDQTYLPIHNIIKIIHRL